MRGDGADIEFKEKAKILNREEGYALKQTIEKLEQYEKLLKEAGNPEHEAAFELVKRNLPKKMRRIKKNWMRQDKCWSMDLILWRLHLVIVRR